MTRIYYYWVIYLCCNGGQSAWQGSWHTHDTWRPGHDSCHNRYLVTACDQELRPPGQSWGNNYNPVLDQIMRGRHSGHSFVVWEDWNIKTRIKGLLYLRSKPRVLQRICSGWIECLHQSKVVMDGSDRVLTRDSFRLRRDFGFSAVWIQCPMSGGRKEGKKPQLCFWYPGFFLPGTLKLKRARGGCDTRTHTLPGPQRPE